MKTWVMVGIALAASTDAVLAQDAPAGEQVFKRLCSPCHDIGPNAKIKLGPPLNGIDGRKAGTFEGFNYSPANKSSGITWSEQPFDKYISAPQCKRCRVLAWHSSASKTPRTSQTFGPTSSNSGPRGRRNETARRALSMALADGSCKCDSNSFSS
jgi:cytochrome c